MKLRSLLHIVVLALMLSLCGGCSIKMLYNNADRLARWGVNDYISMTGEQEAYFTAEVDALHYWHRTEELPRYADYLESLPTTVADSVDEAEVQGMFDTFYSWWESIEARIMPLFTELLLSLNEEQLARLPERLREDNEELAEDEAGRAIDEVQRRWAKTYADTVSRFTGRLSREQREYLEARSVNYLPQFELWADYRARWQADLLELLREGRADPDRFAQALADLIARREAYYGEELAGVFAANEALGIETTTWMLNHLTEAQMARFRERLLELAQDFRELAAEAPATPPPGGGCLVRC